MACEITFTGHIRLLDGAWRGRVGIKIYFKGAFVARDRIGLFLRHGIGLDWIGLIIVFPVFGVTWDWIKNSPILCLVK